MGDELQAVRHLPYYDKIEGWFAGNPEISTIAAYTGMKVASTASGTVVITFEPDRRFANPFGTLQGGLLAMVADAEGDADGYAIWRRIMEAVEGLSGSEPGGKVN